MRHFARGFTIVESLTLLVVAATLFACVMPVLAAAQTNAHSAIAHANLKLLTDAQLSHTHAHDLWLPGPNTTGWIESTADLYGNSTPSTPTQTNDWISPILGDQLRFSPNRAERLSQIMETLACPRTLVRAAVFAGSSSPDLADFIDISTRGLLHVSYVAPAPFHLRPLDSAWSPPGSSFFGDPVTATPTPLRAPIDYVPRLDRVGPPSTKIAVADGVRKITFEGGGIGTPIIRLTSSTGVHSPRYGNFHATTPILDDSDTYGRKFIPGSAFNVELAMRYPAQNSAFGRGMHTARFDGSVHFITAEQAWTDPVPWCPSGSEFNRYRATPEASALYADGAILP